jgi:hypothetical protein
MNKIDMTPIGESWQEVDRFDANQIAGKTPSQLVAFFTALSGKHGDDVRITQQSYTTGGGMNRDGEYTGSTNIYFKVEKLGPEYSAEQRHAQLLERMNKWAATLKSPEYQDEQQKKLRQAMKRIKKHLNTPFTK